MVCTSCSDEIKADHIKITCQGFCKAAFHGNCSGLSVHAIDEAAKHSQLFYLCNPCTKLMSDLHLRSTIRSAYEAGQEKVLSAHNEIVENLKQEIMTELKKEIRYSFATLANSSSRTPISSKRIASNAIPSRRLFSKSQTHVFQKQPMDCGTAESISPSLGIGVVSMPASQPKFWLYLSRISREVTTEQVCEMAKKRLGSEDITTIRLVATGRDINTLSFISFKIGIDCNLKAKALCSSTWPKGILFREFKDNKSNANFWKPQQTPNVSPTATTSSSTSSSVEAMAE